MFKYYKKYICSNFILTYLVGIFRRFVIYSLSDTKYCVIQRDALEFLDKGPVFEDYIAFSLGYCFYYSKRYYGSFIPDSSLIKQRAESQCDCSSVSYWITREGNDSFYLKIKVLL